MGSAFSSQFGSLGPDGLLIAELSAFAWLTYYSITYGLKQYRYSQTAQKGKRRRDLRDSKKFNFPLVTEEKVKKILGAKDVTQLREMQIRREITSQDIVSVYSHRCHTIGRSLNLVTEEYYDEALLMAKEKDAETERAIKNKSTDLLPKLHGIPVSIKDHVIYDCF